MKNENILNQQINTKYIGITRAKTFISQNAWLPRIHHLILINTREYRTSSRNI